jgi:YidC/Oxa1 family membrane protein insertase
MIDTIVNLLLIINQVFAGQLGITLIVIGVAARVVFTPMLKKQHQHSQAMQQLQPQIQALKNKYPDDKVKQAQAQQKLFQDAGVNPAAGCLPIVVQMGIFIMLYQAILRLFDKGLNTDFLGIDLALPDILTTVNIGGFDLAIPGLFLLVAAGSQLVQTKMMLPKPVSLNKADSPGEIEEKTDLAGDIARAQSSMVYLFPLMFLFFGVQFPAGLALYWSATSITAILQQRFIFRHHQAADSSPARLLPIKASAKTKSKKSRGRKK